MIVGQRTFGEVEVYPVALHVCDYDGKTVQEDRFFRVKIHCIDVDGKCVTRAYHSKKELTKKNLDYVVDQAMSDFGTHLKKQFDGLKQRMQTSHITVPTLDSHA